MWWSLLVCCMVGARPGAATLSLNNSFINLLFGEATDGFALQNVSTPHFGFLTHSPRAVLWEIELDPYGTLDSGSPSAQRDRSFFTNATHSSVHLVWKAVQGTDLSVRITVDLPRDSAVTQWTASLETQTLAINTFTYYPLHSVGSNDPANDHLLVPFAFGEAFTNPLRNRDNVVAPYPSFMCPVQFMAWWHTGSVAACRREGCGLYFAAHDPAGNAKTLLYSKSQYSGSSALGIRVPLEDAGDPQRQRLPPFPVAVGVFAGEWWDAAQIYREWAIRGAQWTQAGDLRTRVANGLLPRDYVESSLWFNSGWQPKDVFEPRQGDPERLVTALTALQEALGGDLDTNLHWYVWSRDHRFDEGYPDYFPPRDGFGEAVRRLRALNVRVFPYVNGRMFDTGIPMWKADQAQRYATKTRAGGIPYEDYGNALAFAPMCPYTPYWQQKIAGVVRRLVQEFDVAGVYVDQVGSQPPALCTDRSHNHTLLGGNYWRMGYRRMLELSRVRRAADQPYGVLVTEENAEAYMDQVGGYLLLEGYANFTVGSFSAVYGGYAITMGSIFMPVELTQDPRVFQAHVARMLVFGSALGWMSLGDSNDMLELLLQPQYRPQLLFLRTAVQHRRRAVKYLVYGRMLRPVRLTTPVPVIPSRGTYYRAVDYPAVLTGAWLEGPVPNSASAFPSVLVLMANAHSEALEVGLSLDLSRYELPASPLGYSLHRHDLEGDAVLLGTYSALVGYALTLQPREIVALVMQPIMPSLPATHPRPVLSSSPAPVARNASPVAVNASANASVSQSPVPTSRSGLGVGGTLLVLSVVCGAVGLCCAALFQRIINPEVTASDAFQIVLSGISHWLHTKVWTPEPPQRPEETPGSEEEDDELFAYSDDDFL